MFCAEQICIMEAIFAEQRYLSFPERRKFAEDLGLSEQQVRRKSTHALPASSHLFSRATASVGIMIHNVNIIAIQEQVKPHKL